MFERDAERGSPQRDFAQGQGAALFRWIGLISALLLLGLAAYNLQD
jgi:hypothetical protein